SSSAGIGQSFAIRDSHASRPAGSACGRSGQSFALGDSRESPSPTLLVVFHRRRFGSAVGMRVTLWTTRRAINLQNAFDADFYWVDFLLRAARYAGQACDRRDAGAARSGNPP